MIISRERSARIGGVVTDLVDIAHQVAARVHQLHRTHATVQRPRRVFKLVFVGVGVVLLYVQVAQGRVVGEDAIGFETLVTLLDEGLPVVADLVEHRGACALVGHWIGRVVDEGGVREAGAAWWHDPIEIVGNPDVAGRTGERSRYVMNVAAPLIVVDHRAYGELVLDQRQIQDRLDRGAGVAMGRRGIVGVGPALGHIELRLVGDIADRSGLRSGAVQRALWALQNFNALQIRGVDVEVAAGKLRGLIVEVNGNVRKCAGAACDLATLVRGRQPPHIDFALARANTGCADIGQVFHEVIESLDVELFQRGAGECRDGNRHILQILRASRCGDDDFFEPAAARLRHIALVTGDRTVSAG